PLYKPRPSPRCRSARSACTDPPPPTLPPPPSAPPPRQSPADSTPRSAPLPPTPRAVSPLPGAAPHHCRNALPAPPRDPPRPTLLETRSRLFPRTQDPWMAFFNHARANVQSLSTVRNELSTPDTFSASTASSAVSPPKNRSSTTRACL